MIAACPPLRAVRRDRKRPSARLREPGEPERVRGPAAGRAAGSEGDPDAARVRGPAAARGPRPPAPSRCESRWERAVLAGRPDATGSTCERAVVGNTPPVRTPRAAGAGRARDLLRSAPDARASGRGVTAGAPVQKWSFSCSTRRLSRYRRSARAGCSWRAPLLLPAAESSSLGRCLLGLLASGSSGASNALARSWPASDRMLGFTR